MSAFKQRGGMVQKPEPPIVFQPVMPDSEFEIPVVSPTCWAAGLSSWLSAARAEEWTIPDLLRKFEPYLTNQSLRLPNFKDVAASDLVRMDFQIIGGEELTWDYLYDKLKFSYVYAMLIFPERAAHAMVIHAITLDSSGTKDIHFMDPLKGMGQSTLSEYQRRAWSYVIAWAKEGTKFMLTAP